MAITLSLVRSGTYLGSFEPQADVGVLIYDHPMTGGVHLFGSVNEHVEWVTGGYAALGNAVERRVVLSENRPTSGYTAKHNDATIEEGDWTPTFNLSGEAPGRWWRIRTTWIWAGPKTWAVDRYVYLVGDGEGADGEGQVVALFAYQRPEVQHVVYQTLNGDLIAKQNPS